MDKFFKISERGSTFRTEIVGGITTFFAMAYIIFVNPITLCVNLADAANPFYPAMPKEPLCWQTYPSPRPQVWDSTPFSPIRCA